MLGAAALPGSAAVFITSNQTVANGNPLVGNYSGQLVIVGRNGALAPMPGVQVDVLDPAQLHYSDQTGGGMRLHSD